MIQAFGSSLRKIYYKIPLVNLLSLTKLIFFWLLFYIVSSLTAVTAICGMSQQGPRYWNQLFQKSLNFDFLFEHVALMIVLAAFLNFCIFFQEIKSMSKLSKNEPLVKIYEQSGHPSKPLQFMFILKNFCELSRIPLVVFLATCALQPFSFINLVALLAVLFTMAAALIIFRYFSSIRGKTPIFLNAGIFVVTCFVSYLFANYIGNCFTNYFVKHEPVPAFFITVFSFKSLFLVLMATIVLFLPALLVKRLQSFSYMRNCIRTIFKQSLVDANKKNTMFYAILAILLTCLISSSDSEFTQLSAWAVILYPAIFLVTNAITSSPEYFEFNDHVRIFVWHKQVKLLMNRCIKAFLTYIFARLVPIYLFVLCLAYTGGWLVQGLLMVLLAASVLTIFALCMQSAGMAADVNEHENAYAIQRQKRVSLLRNTYELTMLVLIVPVMSIPAAMLIEHTISLVLYMIFLGFLILMNVSVIFVVLKIISKQIKDGVVYVSC